MNLATKIDLAIKICGLRSPETLDAALDAGADMVGFVFFPRSPRHVDFAAARGLAARVSGRALKVALSVDADDEWLAASIEALQPDLLQLHGKETPERIATVQARFHLPVMKAVPVETADDLACVPAYAAVADRLIFDARAPRDATRPGGLGKAFDWQLLKNLDPAVPFMLSGGLNRDNVAEAIAITGARGVDVSSGVERAPGDKDPGLIRGFIQAARAHTLVSSAVALSALAPSARGGNGVDAGQVASQMSSHAMNVQQVNSYRTGPDEHGHFGIYGGRFVAETLMPLILDLERAYTEAKADPAFRAEMDGHLATYVGRPSPLYFAQRLTEHCGGAKIYFKREELNHTGAHKVNNVLGQIMLARRMRKPRIIAETGAGMHGVATATLCAKFGLPCIVYMGAVDVERQQPNVLRMRMLGAEVRAVQSGSRTLKDAMNEALRDWVTNVADTFYCIGTVAGPHPYPAMVRDFQSIIGRETREQMQAAEGRLPDSLVACIGGGSNAMGLFHPFLDDRSVEIYGVEAAGHGIAGGKHAASIAGGRPGVLHGNRTYLLMNGDGQIDEAHSISAGLDYPGIGPEHAWLKDMGRVTFLSATDAEAVAAFQLCSRLEGIIPALEPAHALARAAELAAGKPKDHLMVVNLSGRGDKDLASVEAWLQQHSR
jgi:tryptophan synthase beta chain